MDNLGTIVLIDDDDEDLEIFHYALAEMKLTNKILLFNDPDEVVSFMQTRKEHVFFILCDTSMPGIDPILLRSKIADIVSFSSLSVPFLYYSTCASDHWLQEHGLQTGRDYFVKPSSVYDIKAMFLTLIAHWKNYHLPAA